MRVQLIVLISRKILDFCFQIVGLTWAIFNPWTSIDFNKRWAIEIFGLNTNGRSGLELQTLFNSSTFRSNILERKLTGGRNEMRSLILNRTTVTKLLPHMIHSQPPKVVHGLRHNRATRVRSEHLDVRTPPVLRVTSVYRVRHSARR